MKKQHFITRPIKYDFILQYRSFQDRFKIGDIVQNGIIDDFENQYFWKGIGIIKIIEEFSGEDISAKYLIYVQIL